MNLKIIRKEIQKTKKIVFAQLTEAIDISKNSIFRVEDEERFYSSIYIKYLVFLRKNNVDINAILDQKIKNDTQK